MKTIKVKNLPQCSFIIEEEYGFRHHIWIDLENKFDRNFDFASLTGVGQIEKNFGGLTMENVHILLRLNPDDRWSSLSGANIMPIDFEGKVVVVTEDEDGNPLKAYDGTNLKWIGIDCE